MSKATQVDSAPAAPDGAVGTEAGRWWWPPRRAPAYMVGAAVVYVVVLITLLFVGRHVTLPNERQLDSPNTGGLNVAVRELIGRGDPTDFLIDYASTHALLHGGNAYGITSDMLHGVGPAWPVHDANPHPPTVLTLLLPATLLRYDVALAAWELAMIFAFIGTALVLGVRLLYAVPLGVAIGLTFPGAYGIANPVPLIGLGIAIAYRWRDSPLVAGLGVALAAAPKSTGLLLAAPFLLAGRLRAVGWAAFWYGVAALTPLAIDHRVWTHYFKAGVAAINANSHRPDNGSLLHLGRSWGMSDPTVLVIIGVAVLMVAIARRDLFWPVAWATVAILPIAWMYSLLTFLPILVWAVLRRPRRSAGLAMVATGLTVGAAPFGYWVNFAFPVVTGIVLLLLVTAQADDPGTSIWLWPRFDPFPASGPGGGDSHANTASVT